MSNERLRVQIATYLWDECEVFNNLDAADGIMKLIARSERQKVIEEFVSHNEDIDV